MTTSRREILKAIPARRRAAAGAVPARAIPPFARNGKPRLRLGLAGYSMRDHLRKLAPAMTLDGFIEKAAEWEVDAVELTSYYFPTDFTPGLRGRAQAPLPPARARRVDDAHPQHLHLPRGPEREKEIAHVKRWLDVAADLGSPAIRIFAGDAQKDSRRRRPGGTASSAIEACAEHAASRGVFLALENHGGVVAEPEGLLEIVRAVQSEWFGVNLDTGTSTASIRTPTSRGVVPYAVTAQVKSRCRRKAGRSRRPTSAGSSGS